MTAGQLKKLLANVQDDVPIVVPGPDHSYREAQCLMEDAEQVGTGRKRELYEWYGEEHASEGGQRITVLVVG